MGREIGLAETQAEFGRNLAEMCREQFPRPVVLTMWAASELAAMATDHVSLGLIYGLVLVTEVASSFESPARQSILPALVPRRLYTRAMTTNSALSSVTSVTGPALGGVLIRSFRKLDTCSRWLWLLICLNVVRELGPLDSN